MAQIVEFEFEIGRDILKNFHSFHLYQSINQHHSFSVLFSSDVLEDKNEALINKSKKLLGKEIRLKIKKVGNVTVNELVFKGIVTQIENQRSVPDYGTIQLSGYSSCILLSDSEKSDSFIEKSIGDIVSSIKKALPENTIEFDVDTLHTDPIPYWVQCNENAYDFLSRTCCRYGEWFYYDGIKLNIGKTKDSEPIKLSIGADLEHFSFEVKLKANKFRKFNYDYVNDKLYDSSAANFQPEGLDSIGKFAFDQSNSVFDNEQSSFIFDNYQQQQDLDNRIKIQKNVLNSDLVICHGSSDNPRLGLGSIIKVDSRTEKGENEIGKYRIITINHGCDGKNSYQNNFVAISASIGVSPTLSHQVYCPSQQAKVTDNDDPDQLGRVKVKFYWQQDNEPSPWIRIADSYRGNKQGLHFVPEVGDVVIIGFENGDPTLPYVLGSIYTGSGKPGDNMKQEDNLMKSIRTKGGNEIIFDDTDNGQKIIIKNNNYDHSFELDFANGKIITKFKDVEIKAQNSAEITSDQTINISSKQDLTLESTTKVKVKGTEVEIKADAQGSVEAANLQLKGKAMASLEAAIVKIN